MLLGGPRKKLSGLRIGGVELPPGSDTDIRVSLGLISGAADLRRTVNADLLNVARAVFQKYAISITGSGFRPAGLAGLAPGDYVEVIVPEPIAISVRTPATTVELPRAGIDVVGLTADGRRVLPDDQPPSPLPLQVIRSGTRTAALRIRPSVTFSEPVTMVRYRAALACGVVGWSIDDDERLASSSWSLGLEEI